MRSKVLIILMLVASLFLAGWQMQKTTWEYKVENGIAEKKINELGAQGWELASCGSYNGGMPYCIFKRAK